MCYQNYLKHPISWLHKLEPHRSAFQLCLAWACSSRQRSLWETWAFIQRPRPWQTRSTQTRACSVEPAMIHGDCSMIDEVHNKHSHGHRLNLAQLRFAFQDKGTLSITSWRRNCTRQAFWSTFPVQSSDMTLHVPTQARPEMLMFLPMALRVFTHAQDSTQHKDASSTLGILMNHH